MKICVVVPVYNCASVLPKVIDDLTSHTKIPILVVDDGSEIPVQGFIDQNQVSHLRLEKNCGKGVALQRAFAWAFEQNFTHILSFDGDGQHLAENLSLMIKEAQAHPHSLIVGCRQFSSNVPGSSKFGRRFSNFWVWYQTGASVQDSQSGLRLYPLEPLRSMTFYSGRYDFEIEVLVRLLWKGVPVIDVPTSVFYPSQKDRISHFHKFKDNARISLLNIYLIAYSLLFKQKSFFRAMISAILATFVVLVKPWWFMIIAGISLCVLLRLNAILLFTIIGCLYLF